MALRLSATDRVRKSDSIVGFGLGLVLGFPGKMCNQTKRINKLNENKQTKKALVTTNYHHTWTESETNPRQSSLFHLSSSENYIIIITTDTAN